ncbi:MAG: LysM peptidoglycan-binding domain-containing protein, partial [Dokdonella sp.]
MPVLNAVSSAPASALPSSQETGYSVQRGDTLSAIASEHGVSLDSLLAANPQIRNPNVIYPEQQLSIPGGGSTPELASVQPTSVASTAANGSF